ncbi:MAG TPA: hypothetical protein DD738_11575 [Ruminiclostridium sp.]|jgi:hypothetical protein|nr:hypothetical protein [Ruminiclostridium sp.]
MKQYITVEDLKSLSDSQKQTLNSLWLPAKYDRAVASVCKDVEKDIYEDLEFVVGDIALSHGTSIILRRLRLADEMVKEDHEMPPENDSTAEDEAFDMDFDDPGDYFMKEDCLPLFNIGQLISFLRNTKAGQNGFSIGIPPVNDRFEQNFTLDDRFGEVAKSEGLADLLFDMIKTVL